MTSAQLFRFFAVFILTFIVQSDALADHFIFKLTQGKGVPVCEAYLKRLNDSDFDKPPFCGRPEDDSVPGFTRLNRVPLTAEEIHDLYPKVEGFQSYQNQNKWKIQLKDSPFKEFMSLASVRSDMGMNRVGAWRYEPPVDIDNDGQPDNVLMWYQGRFACGSIGGYATYPEHGSFTANILDAKNQCINEARTRELFGHPVGGYPIIKKGKFLGLFPGFRYVGMSMGIFAYEGAYYFDTFFDGWGDFSGKRRGDFAGAEKVDLINRMTATLGVFQRKEGKTKQICEYYWPDWKKLELGRNTK
ncbi:MAG: hypothetical protein ACYC2R_14405 [Burkholderiales bacterium]